MTHLYSVSGMTCEGCASKVKNLLSKISGVTQVNVNLSKNEVSIDMNHHVETNELQSALTNTKYSLAERNGQPVAMNQAEEKKSLKTYLPVFLIFGYITIVTLLIQFARGSFNPENWMEDFMAGFFLVFSFFKMLDVPGFAASYRSYDIVAKRFSAYGYIYPFIELSLGILYLTHYNPILTNSVTFAVMTVSTIGVVQSLVRKTKFQCACLGTVFNLPMSTVTLIEDILMVVMSGFMLAEMLFG
jgi:copper chaperone CopZ